MRARILHGLSSHYDKWDDFALFNDFTRTKINKLQKCKKERSTVGTHSSGRGQ